MLPATTEPAAAEPAPGNSLATATDEASNRVALRTLSERSPRSTSSRSPRRRRRSRRATPYCAACCSSCSRRANGSRHADGGEDEHVGLSPTATRVPAVASVQKETVAAELKETVAELKETVAELKETLKEPLDASLDAFICPITHEIIADPVIDTWRATLTSAPPS